MRMDFRGCGRAERHLPRCEVLVGRARRERSRASFGQIRGSHRCCSFGAETTDD
jgi:hypothetical protein